jgi:enoyl-CoA hydratase/carnithine racemase
MDYTEIIYDVADNIATVTLNRPERLNAWTGTMDREYRHALADAETREEVRVIILTGAGRGFCAGLDTDQLTKLAQGSEEISDPLGAQDPAPHDEPLRSNFGQGISFPPAINKPIIAAINGPAAGLGLVNALFCDIRFASDTAKLTTAFVRRGLIAELGISWILPRLVGLQNGLDLLLSGRIVTADEAKEMGLVGRVLPAADLMDAVWEYAREMAVYCSPRSTGITKRLVYDAIFTDLTEAMHAAGVQVATSIKSDDFKEGLASFLENRTPRFTGK